MKKTIILLLVVSCCYSQGLKLSPQETIFEFNEFKSDEFGFASSIPNRYSLKKYVPPVRTQKGGTCVGFSTFYYAMSTMYNKQFNITESNAKFAHSFDPYFLYSIYYSKTNNCDSGLQFDHALNNLKKLGSKKLFFPPFTSCNEKWNQEKFSKTLKYVKPYSIKTWYYIKPFHKNYLGNIKNLIFKGFPVLIGVDYLKSLGPYSSKNVNGVSSNGLWEPKSYEEKDGGHAMCVVGYDDYKYGGAFLIVNSWGTDYGDNGYIWIKYKDFKSIVKEAYVFEPNENIINKPPKVISTTDYRRYSYKTEKNNYSYYEGQYLNNSITGFGIWSNSDKNTFYIGKFDDASMNGFFLILDKNGLFSANASNGKLDNFQKIGFATNNEVLETQNRAKKFFSELDTSVLTIRKANSTKTNKPKKPESDD